MGDSSGDRERRASRQALAQAQLHLQQQNIAINDLLTQRGGETVPLEEERARVGEELDEANLERLLREFDDSEFDLRNRLRANLGPGYETSTPGIEALSDFEQRKAETLAEVRRNNFITTENIANARVATQQALTSSQIQNVLSATQPSISGLAGIASGFGGLIQPPQPGIARTVGSLAGNIAAPTAGLAFLSNVANTNIPFTSRPFINTQTLGKIFGGGSPTGISASSTLPRQSQTRPFG